MKVSLHMAMILLNREEQVVNIDNQTTKYTEFPIS